MALGKSKHGTVVGYSPFSWEEPYIGRRVCRVELRDDDGTVERVMYAFTYAPASHPRLRVGSKVSIAWDYHRCAFNHYFQNSTPCIGDGEVIDPDALPDETICTPEVLRAWGRRGQPVEWLRLVRLYSAWDCAEQDRDAAQRERLANTPPTAQELELFENIRAVTAEQGYAERNDTEDAMIDIYLGEPLDTDTDEGLRLMLESLK
jgi:hypothetical protein